MGIRLNKVLKQLNVSTETVVEYLKSKPDLEPTKEMNHNTKVTDEQYAALLKEFHGDKLVKEKANSIFPNLHKQEDLHTLNSENKNIEVKVVGKIDLDSLNQSTRPKKKSKEERRAEREAKAAQNSQSKHIRHRNSINEDDADNGEQLEIATPLNENLTKTNQIRLSQLRFEEGRITFRTGNDTFIFRHLGFTPDLNKHKNDPRIKDVTTQIILDYSKGTFDFADKTALRKLEDFKAMIDNELFEAHLKDVERQKEQAEKNRRTVEKFFVVDKITFTNGRAMVRYKGQKYYYDNSNIIDFDRIIHRIHNRFFQIGKYLQLDNVKVILDIDAKTFTFPDIDICEYVNRLKKRYLSQKMPENAARPSKPRTELRLQFHTLRFGHGLISITHKGKRYIYRDREIRDYENILGQVYSRVSKARKNAIKASLVKVEIDTEAGTFTFVDFDVCKYVNNLRESFLPERKKADSRNETLTRIKDLPRKPAQSLHSMTLGAGNIHFYNGYFLIFHTIKGEVDNAVTPYRVNDADSHEILNLVHNFFEQRFEQMRIMVKFDETKILEPARSDLYQLNKYVRTLRRNLEVKGEWWEEVQNARKRTFGQCFGEPTDSVKKRFVKSKNEYLYNLASLQNDRKLIRVYEINHGKEEDAFIFTISMSDNRCAIIFENASNDASTTTWVFIAKNENYEACVNLMFDYFTDYTISAKRSSLRDADTNPPEMFKAEDYTFIDHNDLGQWLKKLNRILENKPQPSDIKFVPGLNIPQSSDTRTGHGDAITTKNLHNELMRKLYDRLCVESGKDNVGTEIRVGAKRIDAVVKGTDFYDLYEVKTALNPFDCVTEALGQLCQYAYLFCRDKIGKMVIAGASEPTKEVEHYLATLRKNHSLNIYYIKV